jgi:hypothetical protein
MNPKLVDHHQFLGDPTYGSLSNAHRPEDTNPTPTFSMEIRFLSDLAGFPIPS